jgi:hypothetical protein
VGGLDSGRVNDVYGWSEKHVRAGCLEHTGVGFKGSRVLLEVLAGTKLQRVDKNRNNNEVGILSGLTNQRKVALVKRPHGWHKGNLEAGAARQVALFIYGRG